MHTMSVVPRDPRTNELLEQARAAESKGYWQKGAELMTEALALRPEDAEVNALFGWYTWCDDFADKEERERIGLHHLQYAAELERNNPIPLLYLGKMYMASGDASRAELSFKNALSVSPGFAPAALALKDLGEATRAGAKPAKPKFSRPARPGRTRTFVLGGLFGVLCVAYALMFFQTSDRKRLKELASTIETGLPIVDGYRTKEGAVSFVVEQSDWDRLTPEMRTNELEAIRLRIAVRGIAQVLVIGGNNPIALITPEKVCTGPECVAWPKR
jgi:tetratricopeptide (TPR) repeat protein